MFNLNYKREKKSLLKENSSAASINKTLNFKSANDNNQLIAFDNRIENASQVLIFYYLQQQPQSVNCAFSSRFHTHMVPIKIHFFIFRLWRRAPSTKLQFFDQITYREVYHIRVSNFIQLNRS